MSQKPGRGEKKYAMTGDGWHVTRHQKNGKRTIACLSLSLSCTIHLIQDDSRAQHGLAKQLHSTRQLGI